MYTHDNVVGNIVKSQGSRQVVEHVADTAVCQVENRNQHRDRARRERLPDFVDKQVVPEDVDAVDNTVGGLDDGRLGRVPESITALEQSQNTVTLDGSLDDSPCLDNDRSLGRGVIEALLDPPKHGGADHVDDSRFEVGEPEPDKALRVCGRDGEEPADVDAPVKDKQVALDGSLGVENVSLAGRRRLDDGPLDGRLVAQHGSQRGLDGTGGKGEDHDGENEGDVGVASVDDGRDGRDDEEGVGKDTDQGTDPDSLETTPFGIL